jgi:hypothetical protein
MNCVSLQEYVESCDLIPGKKIYNYEQNKRGAPEAPWEAEGLKRILLYSLFEK